MSFVIAALTAFVLTGLSRPLGLAVHLVDRPAPGALKVHAEPIPYTGGIAVIGSALLASAASGAGIPASIQASALALLLLGVVDDARPLPPVVRLVLQAGAGTMLAWALPLEVRGVGWMVLAVLVVLATANAVNLVDGQDGLAGGVGLTAALGLAAILAGDGAATGELAALALGGALLGFLPWNLMRAKVFLGNGGAYALGGCLAALTLLAATLDGFRGILAGAVCLGPFAFELTATVVRRTLTRKPVTGGDRDHSYDLIARRVGPRRSTYLFWAIGCACSILGVVIARVPLAAGAILALVAVAAAVLAGVRLWADSPGSLRQLP
jgi:UDP-GlcNAc:undecaprenyl-phosphate GlcNAc-1-phosphate transferase